MGAQIAAVDEDFLVDGFLKDKCQANSFWKGKAITKGSQEGF